jgi:hypothetical protein
MSKKIEQLRALVRAESGPDAQGWAWDRWLTVWMAISVICALSFVAADARWSRFSHQNTLFDGIAAVGNSVSRAQVLDDAAIGAALGFVVTVLLHGWGRERARRR